MLDTGERSLEEERKRLTERERVIIWELFDNQENAMTYRRDRRKVCGMIIRSQQSSKPHYVCPGGAQPCYQSVLGSV